MDSGTDRPPRPEGRDSIIRQLGPYLGLGAQLAASLAVCAGLGWWLDSRFGTGPWLLVTGVVLGAVAGMVSFLRTVSELGKRNRNEPEA